MRWLRHWSGPAFRPMSIQRRKPLLRRCCRARLALSWGELMATIGPITAQYIPLYRRIGELSPAERETASLLVAHEEALRDFSRAEIAGDHDRSLEPIMALGHMR